MEQRLEAAYSKLRELTAVHQQAPMTTNHETLNFVRNNLRSSVSGDLKDKLEDLSQQSDGTEAPINAEDAAAILSLTGRNTSTQSDLVAAEDALDNMQAFYEVK